MENYSDQPNDFSPDTSEVLQEEYEAKAPPIDVAVCGPVKTQDLPPKRTTFQTFSSVGTTAVKILGRDPRRKNATVIGMDQNIRLGATQADANLSGAIIPSVVPFVINGFDEIWASAESSTTDISVITEYWSD